MKIQSKIKGEIKLAGALEKMIENGETILGYEFEGKWLECGDKQSWLESDFYLFLKHPVFRQKIKRPR